MTGNGQQREAVDELVPAFATYDPEFARGFKAGRLSEQEARLPATPYMCGVEVGELWERVEAGDWDGCTGQLVTPESMPMLQRLAEVKRLDLVADASAGDGYLRVTLAPGGSIPA